MVLGTTLLSSLVGAASPSPGSLDWSTAAGCPETAVLEARLDALTPEGPIPERWSARGRIDASHDGYQLRLEVTVEGRVEQRQLRARDCAVLTEAAALMIAVTVDALAATTAVDRGSDPAAPPPLTRPAMPPSSFIPEPPSPSIPAPEPASAEPSRPSQTPARDDEVVRSRERPRTRGGTIGIGIGGGVAVGSTPEVTGGVEGHVGWRLGPVRLIAAGYHWASTSTTLQPGVGVESALTGGLVRGCLALVRARVEVPVCVALDLGAMHGGGVGDQVRARPVRALWVGVSAGSGVTIWISQRFAFHAQGDLVLGARRPAMSLELGGERREVFRMPQVGARLLVGPLVRIW